MLISYKKPKGRFFIVGKPGGSPAVMRHISINVSGGHGSLLVNGDVVTLNENNTWESDFPDGTEIELETVVNAGYAFSAWYDPNEEVWPGGFSYTNPTTITLDGDYSIELLYVELFNVVVETSVDPNYGYITVNGEQGNYSGTVADGNELALQGFPNNTTGDGRTVWFGYWWDGSGYNYDNPTTYTVNSDVTIHAGFYIGHFAEFIVDPAKYSIVRKGQTMTQTFSDEFISGSCTEYEVVCETGYQFDGWLINGVLNGDTSNPRYFCDAGNDYTVEPSVSAATPAQPNDEIWYTSTDGNVVTPNSADFGTGITVTSNTYADGKGVIKLSGNATTIGNNAFKSCSKLTTIDIPDGVTSIGSYAFQACSNLTNINIPNGVTSIGTNAFEECKIASINIPNGVTTIEGFTFRRCSDLTSVTIPSSVTTIGSFAFAQSGLVNLIIPDSVTSIGSMAVEDCKSLTTLELGANIVTIEYRAFYICTHLTSITIYATTPPSQMENEVFDGTNYCPIYVPAASVTAYQGARGWSKYSSRIQAIQ